MILGGQVWQEDADGAHAIVQVMQQVSHLVKHLLADLAAWSKGVERWSKGGVSGVCQGVEAKVGI